MNEASAAVLAAFLAAIAATIGLVITKENKTSEFRQVWIQELRTALTLFGSKLFMIYSTSSHRNTSTPSQREEINRLLNEINLRINYGNQSPEEKELYSSLT